MYSHKKLHQQTKLERRHLTKMMRELTKVANIMHL